MELSFFLQALEAILETVFLCLAIYYLICGIKTKNYRKAIVCFGVYLILNFIRRIAGF